MWCEFANMLDKLLKLRVAHHIQRTSSAKLFQAYHYSQNNRWSYVLRGFSLNCPPGWRNNLSIAQFMTIVSCVPWYTPEDSLSRWHWIRYTVKLTLNFYIFNRRVRGMSSTDLLFFYPYLSSGDVSQMRKCRKRICLLLRWGIEPQGIESLK